MSRLASFIAGLVAFPVILAGLAYVEPMSFPAAADPVSLCIDGHPARRSQDVTYAGLLPRHGYQRDHIVPLCLGGPDTRDNLQYQPLDAARIKDQREWEACEQFCRGEITLDQARARFQ